MKFKKVSSAIILGAVLTTITAPSLSYAEENKQDQNKEDIETISIAGRVSANETSGTGQGSSIDGTTLWKHPNDAKKIGYTITTT